MEAMVNTSTSFVLLGLAEMERLKYLYCALSILTYFCIMFLNTLIAFVVFTDQSLHEPMYILICNLVLNGIFGSSSFFPKLLTDLFTSAKTISRDGCLVQLTCLNVFAYFEIATFTIMAYDRYLAICQPLRYPYLMTNERVVKLIIGSLVFCVTSNAIGTLVTARVPFCGTEIQNVFCDKMSLLILSCVDSTVSKVHTGVMWGIYLILTISVICFSYLKITIICLTLSKESRNKAVHTMTTHVLGFSVFMASVLFVSIRYRLDGTNLPVAVHNLISVAGLVTSPLFNPLIYGLRTKSLNVKVIRHLQKINRFTAL